MTLKVKYAHCKKLMLEYEESKRIQPRTMSSTNYKKKNVFASQHQAFSESSLYNKNPVEDPKRDISVFHIVQLDFECN